MLTITVIWLVYMAIGLVFARVTWSHVLGEAEKMCREDKLMFEVHRTLITICCWGIFTGVWPLLMLATGRDWLRRRLLRKAPDSVRQILLEEPNGEEPST